MVREIRRGRRTLTADQREAMRRARAEEEAAKEENKAKASKVLSAAKARTEAGIGGRIKRLRTAAGLSQQTVAAAAAESTDAQALALTPAGLQAALSRIESGMTRDPGALTLRALAHGLGVPLHDILCIN